jgi:hypothetical protein
MCVTPPGQDGSVVIFNATDIYPGCDRTCVLAAGDHPYLRRESIVAYARGRFLTPKAFAALENLRCYESRE